MSGAPTIAELVVGGDPERWRAAGFTVGPGNQIVVGTVSIRIDDDPDAVPGVGGWSLRGVAADDIDGLPTSSSNEELARRRVLIRTASSRSITSSSSRPISTARSTRSRSAGSSCGASVRVRQATGAR